MKAFPSVVALGAVASLAFAPASFAAVSCPDRTPSAISAPTTGLGRDCQNAIAKAALSYVKAQVKTDAKCLSKQVPGNCPNAKDTEKVQKAALKARDAIVATCGTVGGIPDLATDYSVLPGNATGADVITSCTLSQNNAEGQLLALKVNGTAGKVRENKDRDKCVKTINNKGVKYALATLQAVNKCLASAISDGVAGDLANRCIGHWAGGTFVAPTDEKTGEKLAKELDGLEASIDKACNPVPASLKASIFACPGGDSVDDYQNCSACGVWDSVLTILAAQYSESFDALVTPGSNAIQNAVDASGPGDKLLIGAGTYLEDVIIRNFCVGGDNDGDPCGTDADCPNGGTCNKPHTGLQLVGCGGATNDRPVIDPPTMGAGGNGIDAASVDGLVFQSLDVGPWTQNGIFVTTADGVTFRDVVSDAEDISKYAVFPIQSENVLVEGCLVEHVSDAGIYVGQSKDIIVRYNRVHENVAGIEIENSLNASVHNNFAQGNTGGILIFKLPGLPSQNSNFHEIFFNVSDANNRENVGEGTVGTVPDGTGILVLSNDDGNFHHNIMTNNNSFGFVLVDQQVINFLASPNPPPFPITSHACAAPDQPGIGCTVATQATDCPLSGSCVEDQKSTGNSVHDNYIDNSNGNDPDTTPPNTTQGVSGPLIYAVGEEDGGPNFNNNCFEGNVNNVQSINGTPLTNCP